jgi:hypothetical protein
VENLFLEGKIGESKAKHLLEEAGYNGGTLI